MTKLLVESNNDEQFNKQLDKIQQAIMTLEKIVAKANDAGSKPLKSQLFALDVAVEDIIKIKKSMSNG